MEGDKIKTPPTAGFLFYLTSSTILSNAFGALTARFERDFLSISMFAFLRPAISLL